MYISFKRHGKTKKIDACWVFGFVVHTFVTIDWLVTLVGSCVTFGIYNLWLGRGKSLTKNLDVKTLHGSHFLV
jgi:hypothetical protein